MRRKYIRIVIVLLACCDSLCAGAGAHSRLLKSAMHAHAQSFIPLFTGEMAGEHWSPLREMWIRVCVSSDMKSSFPAVAEMSSQIPLLKTPVSFFCQPAGPALLQSCRRQAVRWRDWETRAERVVSSKGSRWMRVHVVHGACAVVAEIMRSDPASD